MELTLTFTGIIPAQRTDLEVIWTIRREFDRQLSKVWGKAPFAVLKKWEDSGFVSGAPRFTREVGGHTFVPLYGEDVGVGVDLDITLLTGMPAKKRVISAGDLDNRIKRLIDGLRIPSGHGEMSKTLPESGRWHCLLRDDSAVLGLRARLGTYLGSDDPSVSCAILRVKPVALKVTTGNLEMLF